jgi:hypothetical protein
MSPRSVLDSRIAARNVAAVLVACAAVLGACGGENTESRSAHEPHASRHVAATATTGPGRRAGGAANLVPAEATVGPDEVNTMSAPPGTGGDETQPPPKDPPEGVHTYPATTNRSLPGPIEYDREPPTNGDHDPQWQTCGFYETRVQNRHAVHALDHGAVWITYGRDVPTGQIEALSRYALEPYVLVSPYPGQGAPVIATAWRNQLRLDDAYDPRLRQFVDQFRLSETAPLSGNGCGRVAP